MRTMGRGRFVWVWAAIWLVYLGEPLRDAWRSDDAWARDLGLATVALFGVVFVIFFVIMRKARFTGQPIPLVARWAIPGVLLALTIGVAPAVGESALGMLTYVAVTGFFTLPMRPALVLAAVLAATPIVLPHFVGGWEPQYGLAFSIFLASFAVWGVVQLITRNAQLTAAREEIARLAVADERNRLARDLHDLLGHSLTVVAVKAELAGRLVKLAPERAEEEIADVERLARQSLRDVRAAVAGYAEASLAAELAGAQAALTAAGIEADLPDDVESVPADRRPLFGWVVREGVTNVVRHSGAKRCRIRIVPSEVEITDDGHGPSEGAAGRGLAGLRERAEAAGGSLTIGHAPDQGFTLRVRVP
ncbi:two-component sensor histidine kinase [Phytohabitans rumicis]|uniref:Two-component sensor histidine kinase n=2 Tax=Phytohabitans rumicis TaxID=1076125 RepID=A0A6V8LKP4_9ACTN|nr:two-component sensor histidine kinase [Phytohabitans rumicis]